MNNEKRKVEIEIRGYMGTGKSSLAHYIIRKLIEIGIYSVKLRDDGPYVTPENLENLKRLDEEIEITVIVKDD